MEKKVLIIGAGIAGLSAGCYARMNGYDAEIYEMHDKAGGLCTSWQRKGYTIDGCIHWLTGSSPISSFYKLWSEVGAVQGRRMIDHEVFCRLTGSDGRILSVFTDLDRFEKHLKELSPRDSENIELLCRLARKFTKFQPPVDKAFELFSFWDIIKLIVKVMPFNSDMNFCNKITIGEFAGRFKDPLLRETLPLIVWEKDYPLFTLVMTLAQLQNKDACFPEGGSLEFARAIEKRCLDLGGKIFYKTRVDKILEENGQAVGIRFADGKEVTGDCVISCADLRTTLYQMLDGRHIDPAHEELFNTCKVVPSIVQVSFGVNMDLSPYSNCGIEFFKPKRINDDRIDWVEVRNLCFDKTLAPSGKSVVEVEVPIKDFSYWEKLARDRKTYLIEKEKIASLLADELELKYPGFKSSIEVTDVATPMTYVRYTGNWKGTFMTWVISPDKVKKFRTVKKAVPGLDNFWLAGMWVQPPGGVPTGVMTARQVIQILCKRDGKKFTTSEPQA